MLTRFAQELFSSCVAACVRIVVNGLGDSRNEAQVRQLLGYTRLGVSLVAAQARLAEAGAMAEWHTDWNLTDLRDAVPRRAFSDCRRRATSAWLPARLSRHRRDANHQYNS